MNESLRDYFERIESFFCRQRGTPLLLSPLDFEKALEWYAAGIDAEVVEEGVADYFRRLATRKVPLRRAICLSFAEDCVLKAREARRAAAVGRQAGLPDAEPEAVRLDRFLGHRSRELRAFASDAARSAVTPLLARFLAGAAEEIDALRSASHSASRLEASLAPLDRELCSLALLESPEPDVKAWKEAARHRLGDLAEAMDPEALRQTLDKLAKQSALARLGLPRLSLLYMEG